MSEYADRRGFERPGERAQAAARTRRSQGYSQGRAGRAALHPDDDQYMASYRRGLEARAAEAEAEGR